MTFPHDVVVGFWSSSDGFAGEPFPESDRANPTQPLGARWSKSCLPKTCIEEGVVHYCVTLKSGMRDCRPVNARYSTSVSRAALVFT
jgi:hypothetical protein